MGNTHQVGGIDVDFLHTVNPATGSQTSDDVADDREEALLPLKWLENIATTRSDVYAAYFVVRGYDSGDFDSGPIESARVMVIIDRGTEDGEPRVLAVQRIE